MKQSVNCYKIISWNINSVRLRLPLLQKFVVKNQPDVICLQETKVVDELFPVDEIKNLGFDYIEFSGEKSYNGVAILSKIPFSNPQKIDILGYSHKRHLSFDLEIAGQKIALHNFYVPAGGDIPDVNLNDKFDHKLKFVDWMGDFFKSQKNQKIIMVGDMNIAPLEHDVWSHKQLLNVVSHTPIEVEKMNNLQKSLDWVDSHRLFVDESQKLYSWWSYRARNALESDRGRRLDHIWTTPNLKNNICSTNIYKEFRAEERPSDHVPIETIFNFN